MRHALLLLALSVALVLPASVTADYAHGLVAFERGDIATAHREFSVLANQGHSPAQYSLAMLYLKSAPPDYAKARPWLEKSARQGLADAQYMIGMLSVYGVGMAKDEKQGLQWLERASEQGNEEATALLANLKTARLHASKSKPRKTDKAKKLRAELEDAKAAEQALQKQLAQSKLREKKLMKERISLQKARASEQQAADRMRRERDRLQTELVALRSQLNEQAPRREVVQTRAPEPEPEFPDEPPGEAVVSGRILEILPEGVLLTEVSRRLHGQNAFVPEDFDVFVNLVATHGLSQGQEVAFVAEPTTAYRYKDKSGATGAVRAYQAIGTWQSD